MGLPGVVLRDRVANQAPAARNSSPTASPAAEEVCFDAEPGAEAPPSSADPAIRV
ncbi:hypothetical protein NWFMUON74_26310 [Nocardia wallacei]|uniref:Uncharacterized protein n=1 Tax=Nocardia wallacei TaxID=480035 RepID=A0A7G1KLK5_9NOCA|nr:hypothetical protein NWFMUON74_26310 [Nocardia wallacei]